MACIKRVTIVLIAGGASLLTSAIRAVVEAVYVLGSDSVVHILSFMVGRMAGEIPSAVICMVVAYLLLKMMGIQADGTKSNHA